MKYNFRIQCRTVYHRLKFDSERNILKRCFNSFEELECSVPKYKSITQLHFANEAFCSRNRLTVGIIQFSKTWRDFVNKYLHAIFPSFVVWLICNLNLVLFVYFLHVSWSYGNFIKIQRRKSSKANVMLLWVTITRKTARHISTFDINPQYIEKVDLNACNILWFVNRARYGYIYTIFYI